MKHSDAGNTPGGTCPWAGDGAAPHGASARCLEDASCGAAGVRGGPPNAQATKPASLRALYGGGDAMGPGRGYQLVCLNAVMRLCGLLGNG